MKKNSKLEERRKKIPAYERMQMDRTFAMIEKIDSILKKQGKDQSDLAFMLKKSESEISKWMRGTHNFTMKTICKIEEKLGEPIIKCVDVCDANVVSIVTEYSITANSNAEIIKQIPSVKAQVVSRNTKSIKISLTSISVQENDSTLVIFSHGNCN